MTDEDLEREAEELHAKYPRAGPGTIFEWSWLTDAGKEFWRGKVRNGERAADLKEKTPPAGPAGLKGRASSA